MKGLKVYTATCCCKKTDRTEVARSVPLWYLFMILSVVVSRICITATHPPLPTLRRMHLCVGKFGVQDNRKNVNGAVQ